MRLSSRALLAQSSLLLGLFFALASAHAQDINGGASWSGWTPVGMSNSLGIWAGGVTNNQYQIYMTTFAFNNHTKTGTPTGGGPTGGTTGFGTGSFSSGAFTNGNFILGIGVKGISGSSVAPTSSSSSFQTIKFDLDSDSYQAASSVGGTDGRFSASLWSEQKDYSIQHDTSNFWMQNLTMQTGQGTSYGGPSNPQQIVGGFGSGVSYDWPARVFGLHAGQGSWQMLIDVTALQNIYGVNNPFGLNSSFTGIGNVAGFPAPSSVRISMNVAGTDTVFNAPIVGVPEPSTLSILTLGLAGLAFRRRRS
jgi:hypothetical protein